MSRLINISDDVYKELTRLKGKASYSELVRMLLQKRSNKELILSFAGKGGVDEEAIGEVKKGWKKWSEKSV